MRLYQTERLAVVRGTGISDVSDNDTSVSTVSTTKQLTRANRCFLISLGFRVKQRKTYNVDRNLCVDQAPLFDESITHFEFHTHAPYAPTRYGNNEEIRIPLQQRGMFTLPYESYLYIEGKLSKNKGVSDNLNIKLVNNAIAFLFEEIRYELAGVEVYRTEKVGITMTIKNLLTVSARDVKTLSNAGWVVPEADTMNQRAILTFVYP